MLEKLNLDGRVAIVTGGGSGIGRAICHSLARAGADIVVAGRRQQPIEETAEEVVKLGRQALAISTDITDSKQVDNMVAKAISRFGKVDILVNNAGVVREQLLTKKLIDETTDEDWRLGVDTNLTGVFYCSRSVIKHMLKRGYGNIVNIASAEGLRGGRGSFMYPTAKAGVIQLTKAMALTWAQNGIRVNCLAPGQFSTWRSREDYDARTRFIPVGRVGDPTEIGPLVVYLASDASSYITGGVFIIDGGATAAGFAPTGHAPTIPLPHMIE